VGATLTGSAAGAIGGGGGADISGGGDTGVLELERRLDSAFGLRENSSLARLRMPPLGADGASAGIDGIGIDWAVIGATGPAAASALLYE